MSNTLDLPGQNAEKKLKTDETAKDAACRRSVNTNANEQNTTHAKLCTWCPAILTEKGVGVYVSSNPMWPHGASIWYPTTSIEVKV